LRRKLHEAGTGLPLYSDIIGNMLNPAVDIDSEAYPNGRFARLHDPDGNPIELWEPAGPEARR
jgi:hypothetical protein